MVPETLYSKVFDRHIVRELTPGQYQLYIGLHLIHEVTSPQAFTELRDRRLKLRAPERTFATADHAIPTDGSRRPYADALNEAQVAAIERSAADLGIRYFSPERGEHGIVHVIAPERGLTQPGMTIACGDSHTSTHGAFGALAFGIGTSQVRDVLATQTLAMTRLKTRKVAIQGRLAAGVTAKDLALHLIRRLGVRGGVGFAYEYCGSAVEALSMDERMTLCNMAIEGGARCGYVNPDEVTYTYLEGREYAPEGRAWDRAVAYWESVRSDPNAFFDDRVDFEASDVRPTVTWGINPEQAVAVDETLPDPASFNGADRMVAQEAYAFMGLTPGSPIQGTPIDVAFIGSCTNGRTSDFEAVARLLQRSGRKVSPRVRALAVPGSQRVRDELIAKGIDEVFRQAGFEFREAGCSMCLALNTDKLRGSEMCASSSNRNFKGRQGSPTGRTLLMSPQMVAAAAIEGAVVDARMMFSAS